MRTLALVVLLLATAATTFSGAFYSGSNSCPTSGNKQVSATSVSMAQLTVSALTANTGKIYFGGPSVTASGGGEVIAGGNYNCGSSSTGCNPATLYFACTVSGDTIAWLGHN